MIINIDDFDLTLDLEVDARWSKGSRGYREPGGLQIDPDEPAGWEIVSIKAKGKDAAHLFSRNDMQRLYEELPEDDS